MLDKYPAFRGCRMIHREDRTAKFAKTRAKSDLKKAIVARTIIACLRDLSEETEAVSFITARRAVQERLLFKIGLIVFRKIRFQAIGWLRAFAMADAVGEDDVVLSSVEWLAGAEKRAREILP